ncbi:hypothetical protein ACWDZ4_20625 [Streptomyces sp. NPDC003016]
MRDGEWYLGYSARGALPACELTFGRTSSGIYCLEEPGIKYAEPDTADANLPGENGVRMGRDYQRGTTVTFQLGVDTVDAPTDGFHFVFPSGGGRYPIGQGTSQWLAGPATPERRAMWNAEGVGILRQAWRGDSVRSRSGAAAWLRHKKAGRIRQLYGRPRNFDVVHSRFSDQGYTPVLCDFESVDDRFYDAEEQTEELHGRHLVMPRPSRPGRPGDYGGDAAWGWEEKRTTSLHVRGRVETYPVIVLHGPGRNLKVTISDLWAVQLNTDIPNGQHVTIDSRPWKRTVLRSTGSSVADKLTRSSPRLAEMMLHPGFHLAKLNYAVLPSDKSPNGPRVEIKWRNAHAYW